MLSRCNAKHCKKISEEKVTIMVAERAINYRKKTKYFAVLLTLIYVLLFPVAIYVALLSPMIFDKPSMTTPVGLIFMFLMGCIPLSMIISIWFMWAKSFQERCRSMWFFSLLPLFTFGIVVVLNAFLQTVFL